ncbi:MAG: hypothetical protein HRT42_06865 [Campylobacteraceae bacterium]|nr:hypothetical protein [Campylobacteraceae bacterium]
MSNIPLSINSRLDMFQKAPVQVSNLSATYVSYDPVNAINNLNPIQFNIEGNDQFMNLAHSYLKIRLKIVKADGTNLVDDDEGKVAFVNHPLASVFKHCKVSLNGVTISTSGDFYPYKAFFDVLFTSSINGVNTRRMRGWDLDTGAKNSVAAADNSGFTARAAAANLSVEQEYLGILNVDFFKQSKNLLSNVKLEITLYPSEATFCLQKLPAFNNACKYVITSAKMVIRKEVISPNTYLPIEKGLARTNASYFYPCSTFKVFNIPQGNLSYVTDNVFNGLVPTKIIVCFVDATSFSGTYGSNPYYFSPGPNLRNISIYKNGQHIPHARTIKLDLTANGDVLEAYQNLLEVCDKSNNLSEGLIFPHTEMLKGLFFYGVDLQSDTDTSDHVSPQQTANISLSIDFSVALTAPLELLLYAVFDIETQISQSRQIIHTFSL